jgi:hypothetical protein
MAVLYRREETAVVAVAGDCDAVKRGRRGDLDHQRIFALREGTHRRIVAPTGRNATPRTPKSAAALIAIVPTGQRNQPTEDPPGKGKSS